MPWRYAIALIVAVALGLTLAGGISERKLSSSTLSPHQPYEGNDESKAEQKADERMADYTFWLMVFTGVLTGLAVLQALMLWRTVENGRVSERAYIKMSHTPPGVTFNNSGSFTVQMQIVNYGKTPAEIIDAHICPHVLKISEMLPAEPDYQRHKGLPSPLRAFLVANDKFFFRPKRVSIAPAEITAIKAGLSNFYLIGYVDYRDKFGATHRAGYARIYHPDQDRREGWESDKAFKKRSNLGFVLDDGYNYDRRSLQPERA
jgi:hypothetical protein